MQKTVEVKNLTKRNKLLLGIILLSLIEIIYFYFMGKPYNYINGLDDLIQYIIIGNIAFFIAYFVLLESSNFRKKYAIIIIGFILLVVAPFVFHSKIPSTKYEDAQKLIIRTEGGKVIKDRDYDSMIRTYEGKEVYLVALEKGNKTYRFAFDPENQRYYPFSN